MTTRKVVADGESDAGKRGLVQVKANELVRRIHDGTLEVGWVLKRMQGIIEGPSGWEEMIHIPLDWSKDLGEVSASGLKLRIGLISVLNSEKMTAENEKKWRLPTEKELDRALRAEKFPTWIYYWSSTPHFDGRGLTVVYRHQEGLGAMSHLDMPTDMQQHPHLLLCREKKLD